MNDSFIPTPPKDIFDSQEKKNEAAINFQGLLVDQGWLLIELIINENLKVIDKMIIEDENLSLDDIKDLRKWRKVLDWMKKLPVNMINQLSNPKQSNPNPDPFE